MMLTKSLALLLLFLGEATAKNSKKAKKGKNSKKSNNNSLKDTKKAKLAKSSKNPKQTKNPKQSKSSKQSKSKGPDRCEDPGSVNQYGLYCPGQEDVDKFEAMMNAWGQRGDLEPADLTYADGDQTMFCSTPPGCSYGKQAVMDGLFFLGSYLTPDYLAECDMEAWESAPGVLKLNDCTEFLVTTGGCEFLQKNTIVIYYDAEGRVHQAHWLIFPNKPREEWVDKLLASEVCDCDKVEQSGSEIFRKEDPQDVAMRLESTIDKGTCTYNIDVSFLPDLTLPYMNDVPDSIPTEGVTAADILPKDPNFNDICTAENRDEFFGAGGPINFLGNTHYTEHNYALRLPKKTREATGFDHITIGAAPCGTLFQPYPHYSFHFYRITQEYRADMKCYSNGGSLCKLYGRQCAESGRKFNMDGEGLTTCADGITPANVPEDFLFTTDGSIEALPFTNAATPGIGLHALNLASLDNSIRPEDMPNLLPVQYDGDIVAHMVVVWSGFALGESNQDTWTVDNITYNCQDMETHGNLPETHTGSYDSGSGRTTFSISGPLPDCEEVEESFTQSVE